MLNNTQTTAGIYVPLKPYERSPFLTHIACQNITLFVFLPQSYNFFQEKLAQTEKNAYLCTAKEKKALSSSG